MYVKDQCNTDFLDRLSLGEETLHSDVEKGILLVIDHHSSTNESS